jgi:hypothetical protein
MGFFSRLVSSVVERAYEVADAVSDYVSERVGKKTHPGCGSVYLSDIADRGRTRMHTQANRASNGFPREGYQQSAFDQVYDNVVDLNLENLVGEVPNWTYEHKSQPRYRTGTEG